MQLRLASTLSVCLLGLTLGACAGDDSAETESSSSTGDSTSTSTTGTTASTTASTTSGTTASTTSTSDDTTSTTASTSESESDTSTSDDSTTTDGTTTDNSTTTDGTTTDDSTTGVDGPSFAETVWPIFMNRCSCHLGQPQAGLQFANSDSAYSMMVGVKAQQLGSMNRVTAGDPAQSYLWHKLNNTHVGVGGIGQQMPPGGLLMPMPRKVVEDWILGGANP